MATGSRPEEPLTQHPEPTFEESHEETRKLQMLEAQKHNKFNTMEQARLDAIARIMQTENEDALKAQEKMVASIKMDRKPQFVEDENIKEIQQSHYQKHKKINTFEQAKLDAIARLALSGNKWSRKAREIQKDSLLSTDKMENENDEKEWSDPKFDRYKKMIQLGVSIDSVRHKMKINKMSEDEMDSFERMIKKKETQKETQQNEDIRKMRKEIEREIKEEYDAKFERITIDTKSVYDARQKSVKKQLNKLQNELDETRQAMKDLEETMKDLEQSKLSLILSTSAEIDALRNALRKS